MFSGGIEVKHWLKMGQSPLPPQCFSLHLSPDIPWQIGHTKWENSSLFRLFFSSLVISR